MCLRPDPSSGPVRSSAASSLCASRQRCQRETCTFSRQPVVSCRSAAGIVVRPSENETTRDSRHFCAGGLWSCRVAQRTSRLVDCQVRTLALGEIVKERNLAAGTNGTRTGRAARLVPFVAHSRPRLQVRGRRPDHRVYGPASSMTPRASDQLEPRAAGERELGFCGI